MVSQKFLDIVTQQLKQGISKEQIRSTLLSSGW